MKRSLKWVTKKKFSILVKNYVSYFKRFFFPPAFYKALLTYQFFFSLSLFLYVFLFFAHVLLSTCNPLLRGLNPLRAFSFWRFVFLLLSLLLINHYEITERQKTKTSIKRWKLGMTKWDCERNANNDQRLKWIQMKHFVFTVKMCTQAKAKIYLLL